MENKNKNNKNEMNKNVLTKKQKNIGGTLVIQGVEDMQIIKV